MPAETRVVLDARLDGGQLWILADPDDHLRHPAPELAPIIGARARPMFRSFWVAPSGFERRWTVAVEEAVALRALITTGWPVTPALGTLLEVFVAATRTVRAGHVLPGPVPNIEIGWTAAPDRNATDDLEQAVERAAAQHPDADELAAYLVHTLASEAVGPIPEPLASTRMTQAFQRWTARVEARARAGARLVVRLDDPADGFTLVACLQARRATTVIAEIDTADDATMERASLALGVPTADVERLVELEWGAVGRAWETLRDRAPGSCTLEIADVIQLVERVAPRLDDAGISVLLPAHLGRRRSTTRRYEVQGRAAGLDVASLMLSGAVQIDGRELSAAELDALVRSQHDLVSISGKWAYLADGERARIAAFVRRLGNVDAATVLEAAADADDDEDSTFDIDIPPDSWLARALLGNWTPEPGERVPVADLVRIPLRDYQRDGLDWLAWLERNDLGGILADDMGLGKTAMLLALVAHDHSGPTLVIAPTSVVGNWMREAKRFTPELRVAIHHGGTRGDPVPAATASDIVITSYGLLRRDARLAEIPWHRVILDEAQAVKNPQTATAKAARALPARHHIAATGTPVENHIEELWSIMTFANPGLLSSRASFSEQYRMTGEPDEDDARLAHLRARVAAFICRRTKTDPGIADELPERIVVRDDCMLTGEQVALYEATATAMLGDVEEAPDQKRRRLHVFAGIAKLKQICNHPASLIESDRSDLAGRSGKLDRLVELAAEIVAEDEAVVVFSQYAGFLKRLAAHVSQELDLPVPILHGGVPRARRDTIVERFSEERGPGVLAVSLRAGGTGLNLVRANHVIHFDRWWNPAVEDQASDRVWRIGQTRGVEVHTLVCPGTIEEKIATVIESKRALAGSVITSTEKTITALDPEELAAFVALDLTQATRE